MVSKLEKEFETEMINIYERARKECKYDSQRFLQMIKKTGVLSTAKTLLASKEYQQGLTRMWELRRLDLTVEALVIKPKFRNLFSQQEIDEAKKRLDDLDYKAC